MPRPTADDSTADDPAEFADVPADEAAAVAAATTSLDAAHPLKRPKSSKGAARSTANQVTGVFRRAQAGFGFVRPADSAPQADRKLDIFIPADRTLDAASGDTVLVRLQKHRDVRRPNPVGEIVEVVERETHQFVGTYFESAGNAFAQTDGTLFVRPISLGDPGAKNARPTTRSFSRWSDSPRTFATARE